MFGYYLDFSLGPAVALFLGGALTVAALFSKLHKIRSISVTESDIP